MLNVGCSNSYVYFVFFGCKKLFLCHGVIPFQRSEQDSEPSCTTVSAALFLGGEQCCGKVCIKVDENFVYVLGNYTKLLR
jgi:hypothetical protein